MLRKLLFRNSINFQFIMAATGALVGLTALLLSFQLILDVRKYHNTEAELFGPNSIVIQKKVTKFTSIGMNNTDFTSEDLEKLRNKSFIKDLAPFKSADFKVGVSEVPGDGLPSFYSDMFFQSIPDRFMDVKVDWSWNQSAEYIPIVLPRDFIMLLNYGFAQSQGMNQISEELLMAARLSIHLQGNGKTHTMMGRVVGFSQKISSILVPESFLDYANTIYGSGNQISPNRVFITIEDDSYGELEALTEEMNLDISQGAIDMVKIKTIVTVVVGIFGIASLLILLLSLLGFIQYAQLMLAKVSWEIKTLIRLGYSVRTLVKTFVMQVLIAFGVVCILAIILMFVINIFVIQSLLEENGIHLAQFSTIPAVMLALICFVVFVGANFLSVRQTIFRLGKE
ncbi:MAG: hypothetical protein IPM74_00660 [Crocinitomicaceae bacterium]|nr:hypothetical protein [Crocinitomicaceae bacterium]MBK8924429.1 hypothetical protein [Crocinitomicaceae bacterium]